ncbi:flagellar biosynthesis regulator FlaF [Pseudoruegeria sp. M32A2M]|nr:flagellar biosynthesis regulator FlaF [Pseudoruegeria sp. M32A2M]
MNAVDMAKKAYGASATPVRTPRDTEYAAFARITQRIRSSASKGTEDFAGLARALHDNRKLWTILATDVAGKTNGLPDQLRSQIIYLFGFVNLQSSKVLRGQASAEPLIEINTAIMRGLRQEARSE